MKFLCLVSTIDLKMNLGCTPSWWQLFKAMYQCGHEVIVVPYLGRAIDSLWWRSYKNPCLTESLLMRKLTDKRTEMQVTKKKKGKDVNKVKGVFSEGITRKLTKIFVQPRWKKLLTTIFQKEKHIDIVLVMNLPLNQFEGIPNYIRTLSNVPIVYYDGDMPTILPQYAMDRGFKFNYYENADLSEYDLFLINSEGVIEDLKKMGAKKVYPFHYGVDPDLIYPVDVKKDRDIAFFGFGSQYRERWMKKMIAEPSKKMDGIKFVIGGGNFGIDLGDADIVGNIPIPEYKYFVGRSKVNLNITRKSHASIYKTSTGRIFELPAMGAVMVSQPYNGLDEFFVPSKEYIQLNEEDNIEEIYKELLSNDEWRAEISHNAREKILKSHTYTNRMQELNRIIGSII